MASSLNVLANVAASQPLSLGDLSQQGRKVCLQALQKRVTECRLALRTQEAACNASRRQSELADQELKNTTEKTDALQTQTNNLLRNFELSQNLSSVNDGALNAADNQSLKGVLASHQAVLQNAVGSLAIQCTAAAAQLQDWKIRLIKAQSIAAEWRDCVKNHGPTVQTAQAAFNQASKDLDVLKRLLPSIPSAPNLPTRITV